jgi:RNA polymerase sigma-70 factor (ECF subfamily)
MIVCSFPSQARSMVESQESPAWLSAARAGSRDALGQGLEAYRRYLLQIANQMLDKELQAKGGASDLVQETFLEAQRAFALFRGKTEGEFRAWLRQVLIHRAGKLVRRYHGAKKRQAAREVPLGSDSSGGSRQNGLQADITSPSKQAIENEQAQALRRALDRLPPDYRQVILLHYQEDRSWEEIGQLMQRSAEAARQLWLRAFERVKQELRVSHDSA